MRVLLFEFACLVSQSWNLSTHTGSVVQSTPKQQIYKLGQVQGLFGGRVVIFRKLKLDFGFKSIFYWKLKSESDFGWDLKCLDI